MAPRSPEEVPRLKRILSSPILPTTPLLLGIAGSASVIAIMVTLQLNRSRPTLARRRRWHSSRGKGETKLKVVILIAVCNQEQYNAATYELAAPHSKTSSARARGVGGTS